MGLDSQGLRCLLRRLTGGCRGMQCAFRVCPLVYDCNHACCGIGYVKISEIASLTCALLNHSLPAGGGTSVSSASSGGDTVAVHVYN